MPVPSLRKQSRRLVLAQASHRSSGDQMVRRDIAAALGSLMHPVDGGTAHRHHKSQDMYKADLHSIRRERLELVASHQRAVQQQQEQKRDQVPVPAELIRISWVWRVRFHVYKPNKQKKYWDDVAEVVADEAQGVEQAVQFLCARKGWELQQLWGAEPTSIAFSYHMQTLERLSKQEEAVVPWPAAFDQSKVKQPTINVSK